MNYLLNTPEQRAEMLARIGVATEADLVAQVPASARMKTPYRITPPLSELELFAELERMSAESRFDGTQPTFAGCGAYDVFMPMAQQALLWRPEFYTAYTPYQAEVAQGTLQVIYEFQSYLCLITGMEAANASVYDGAHAVAEAALLAHGVTGRKQLVVSAGLHPGYRAVLDTYSHGHSLVRVTAPLEGGRLDARALVAAITPDTAAVIVQTPNIFGNVEAAWDFAEAVRNAGALLIVVTEPTSLSLLPAPGSYGADVVCGEAQSLGVPLSFGGPYCGFFTAREQYVRQMPGRIVGITDDAHGRRGYVLTLQTREQHIRRERATSNICTNQGLMATAVTMYMSFLGENGFKALGVLCAQKAHYAAERFARNPGYALAHPDAPFYREFTLTCPIDAGVLVDRIAEEGVLAGVPAGRLFPDAGLDRQLIIAVTEKRTREQIDALGVLLAKHGR